MDITVIVPVYNEEASIPSIYSALKSTFLNTRHHYEIIFIDDGSTDQSLPMLTNIIQQDRGVRIICFDKNYGKTSALDAGFKEARGQIILTIDADSQYDPQDLLRILEELKSEDLDAVLGKRMNRTAGVVKHMSSKIAVFIRNFVLNESYQDASLGGYKKKCFQGLKLYKNTQVFLPAFLRMQGFRIKEINVKEFPRRHGRSKYSLNNRLFKRLHALMAIKWLKDNQLNYKISKIIKL